MFFSNFSEDHRETYNFTEDQGKLSNFTEDHGEVDERIKRVAGILLPVLCGLSIPPSLINIILLLNFGINSQPSNIIYMSMILLDLANCFLGLNLATNHFNMTKSWDTFSSTVGYFAYDTYMVLILGLTLLRFLCVKMSAFSILRNLHQIARVSVVVAGCWGVGVTLYRQLSKDPRSGWGLWYNVVEVVMMHVTIALALYTWWKVRYVYVQTHTYRSATITCLLLVINFSLPCCYYTVLVFAWLYFHEITHTKPTGIFPVIFQYANSCVVGLTFVCLQALVLNLILLSQDHFRKSLWQHSQWCWRDVKRKVGNIGRDSYLYSRFY